MYSLDQNCFFLFICRNSPAAAGKEPAAHPRGTGQQQQRFHHQVGILWRQISISILAPNSVGKKGAKFSLKNGRQIQLKNERQIQLKNGAKFREKMRQSQCENAAKISSAKFSKEIR
jgi:hypothetical protein